MSAANWGILLGGGEQNTMRAEIIAYMIYLEGPEYPEYVMYILYLKYSGTPNCGNMLGNSLPVGPVQETIKIS